jgi:hypothetical protein
MLKLALHFIVSKPHGKYHVFYICLDKYKMPKICMSRRLTNSQPEEVFGMDSKLRCSCLMST